MIDHPTSEIDETVHQRHRLGILTITAEATRAEFGYLRDALDVTPGNLSRHLTVLEDAGLVNVEKGYEGRRPRTWVRITREGRAALAAELDLLAALVKQHAVIARRSRSKQRSDGAPAASEVGGEANGESSADEAWFAVAPAARDAAKASIGTKSDEGAEPENGAEPDDRTEPDDGTKPAEGTEPADGAESDGRVS